MAIITDINVFIYRSQTKIAELGNDIQENIKTGLCVDDDIKLIHELSAAISMFQSDFFDLTDNEAYEAIGYWNKRAELYNVPIHVFDNNCLVDNVLIGKGYVSGPTGATGPQGPKGDTGAAGADGAAGLAGVDGTDGWTAILAVVSDGDRRVHQVSGWTGGSGTAPASGVYVGAAGYVANIADAVDIRGAQGIQGIQGEQGIQGIQGPAGADGAAGLAGVDGDDFTIDATQDLSERDDYDEEPKGFTFLAQDTGDIYIKQSGLTGDWSDPIPFIGDKGWSPEFSVEPDGDRRVLKIPDWQGGEGTKPDIDKYVGPTGLVDVLGDGVDIRGPQGRNFRIDIEGLIANLSTYDAQLEGYTFYATDEGKVYFKLSDTSGDWSVGYDWRGERGPEGPVGSEGNGFVEDVRVATAAALTTTYSSANQTLTATAFGAITVDGVALALNDRVLVKDQATLSQNGIYRVTTVGDAGTAFVLTRTEDFNSSAEVKKFISVYTVGGSTNLGNRYEISGDQAGIILDTNDIEFRVWVKVTSSAISGMAALYVNVTEGNDSTGDGSINKPFASLSKAKDMVQNGQTVIVYAGTYDNDVNMAKGNTETDKFIYTIFCYPGVIINQTVESFIDNTALTGLVHVYGKPEVLANYALPILAIGSKRTGAAPTGGSELVTYLDFKDVKNSGTGAAVELSGTYVASIQFNAATVSSSGAYAFSIGGTGVIAVIKITGSLFSFLSSGTIDLMRITSAYAVVLKDVRFASNAGGTVNVNGLKVNGIPTLGISLLNCVTYFTASSGNMYAININGMGNQDANILALDCSFFGSALTAALFGSVGPPVDSMSFSNVRSTAGAIGATATAFGGTHGLITGSTSVLLSLPYDF